MAKRRDKEARVLVKVRTRNSICRPTTKTKRKRISNLRLTSFSKPYLLFISGKLPSSNHMGRPKKERKRYLGAYKTLGGAVKVIRKKQAAGHHDHRCLFYVFNAALKYEHVVGNRMNFPALARLALQKRA